MKRPTAAAVLRRLDRMAVSQLCAEIGRLAAENEVLSTLVVENAERANLAESAAEWWREDALELQAQLCDATGGRPGLTIEGTLVVIPGGGA